MAVYTKVPRGDLDAMLANYALGNIVACEEILEGVENSNYRLITDKNRYILTLYERRVQSEDLPFFIGLMKHAALKGIPCPLPVADKSGCVLQKLCNREAAIVSHLHGGMATAITPAHCKQVGEALARFHNAVSDFTLQRANTLSISGWGKLVTACTPHADDVAQGLKELISSELAHVKQHWPAANSLPRGVIHADLFPDNVFFDNGQLCGLIDFYFSCNDFLAYDIAVCINSWCFENEKTFSQDRMNMLMQGYESARPLSEAEKKSLPLLLRGAALRFLLTRLYDKLNLPEGAVVKVKDPLEYRDKLLFFQKAA